MSGTLVPVTAMREAADGAPDAGTISLTPYVTAANRDPKRTVTQAPVAADLDDQGAWTVQVVASDDPDWQTDAPVPYIVTERLLGMRRQWTTYINGPGPVDLDDLLPLTEVSAPGTAGWLTLEQGDDRYLIRATGGIVRGPIVLWRDGGVLAAGQIAIVPDPGTPGGDALEMRSDDGILIRGPYIVLDTGNLILTQPGGEAGSPLLIAGFDALGGALMGWGAPIIPAYRVNDSTEVPVTIKAAGGTVIPSPWVPLGLEVVCAEAITAGAGTLAFTMPLLNPTGRSGSVEYGLQINGAAPFAREVRQDVPANFNATVALSIINARDITAGDTLTLVARVVEQSHAQFAVSMQASPAEPARLRVARS